MKYTYGKDEYQWQYIADIPDDVFVLGKNNNAICSFANKGHRDDVLSNLASLFNFSLEEASDYLREKRR